MKNATTGRCRRPAKSVEPVQVELVVRAFEALTAIRMRGACVPMNLDCPLCPGLAGQARLDISVGRMRCTSGSAHTVEDLARLLLGAASQGSATAEADPAVAFCLELLPPERRTSPAYNAARKRSGR